MAFVDNASTDESRQIIEGSIGHGVVRLSDLPYNGAFSLSAQLQAKAKVEIGLDHDWIMHLDADEIPHATHDKRLLTDVAKEAQNTDYNVINFEEFVFIPKILEKPATQSIHLENCKYYLYAPLPRRLMRLYRRGQGLDNRSGAGHFIRGSANVYPQSQVLRHYIALDQEHLFSKYLGLTFDQKEIDRGWHRNRVNLTKDALSVDKIATESLDCLPDPKSRAFLRNRAFKAHFWLWPK